MLIYSFFIFFNCEHNVKKEAHIIWVYHVAAYNFLRHVLTMQILLCR